MNLLRRLSLWFFAFLLLCSLTSAQDTQQRGFTLGVDVDLVQLPVSVVDKAGRSVEGLTINHFQVFENGVQQRISLFQHEDIPLSVGLVIDNSGSMRNRDERANSAALTFVRESNPEDETFIVKFDDAAYLLQDFTGNVDDLVKGLGNLRPTGQTALYDAVYLSVNHVQQAQWDKRVLLLISDGEDTASKHGLDKVIEALRVSKVTRLGFSLQHGFRVIRSGLRRLEVDLNYRIPDQNHELATIVQAINRMTENRQKLEAELRREDRLRAMGRVVAGIAHEIRNPLNSIRLTSRVLARRLQENPIAQGQIEMITGEIDRLDALLKSLLVFQDGELGAIHRQTVLPILKRSMALVQPHAQERGVIVSLDASSDGEAAVDSDHLQQALMNVLLNAVDASERGGVVNVRVQTAPDHIDIAVEDHGPGLSAASQERIFEAFYTTKPGGTGLGLAVTKSVLERMGATIEAANYSQGARFTIQLPREVFS